MKNSQKTQKSLNEFQLICNLLKTGQKFLNWVKKLILNFHMIYFENQRKA